MSATVTGPSLEALQRTGGSRRSAGDDPCRPELFAAALAPALLKRGDIVTHIYAPGAACSMTRAS
jgi:hypothetical protein